MSVVHIVAFNVPEDTVGSLTSAFKDLQKTCQRDGKTYIKSVQGGKQISTEKFHHDTKVTFIMTFDNQDDLAYYLDHDPAHDDFKSQIKGWSVQGVVAMDFVDGQY